jgi:hypothetical protein
MLNLACNRIVISTGEPVTFSIFSCFLHIQPVVLKPTVKIVIPERSASHIGRVTQGLWRGVEEPVLSVAEGTPAILVCRCSWELSGRKLQHKIKSHKSGAKRSGEICGFSPSICRWRGPESSPAAWAGGQVDTRPAGELSPCQNRPIPSPSKRRDKYPVRHTVSFPGDHP